MLEKNVYFRYNQKAWMVNSHQREMREKKGYQNLIQKKLLQFANTLHIKVDIIFYQRLESVSV